MKRAAFIVITFATSYFLLQCNKPKDGCVPEKFSALYTENRSLDTTHIINPNIQPGQPEAYSYQVTAGSNIVFKYNHTFRDCPQVSDDEGARVFVLEVPAGTTSFRKIDDEIASLKLVLQNACLCLYSYPHLIKKGVVEGRKLTSGNRWEIEATLYSSPTQPNPYHFRVIFDLEK